MSSPIEISNMALAYLGQQSIRDFDENNKRARMCKIFYDHNRTTILRKFHWTFAKEFSKLAIKLDRNSEAIISVKGYTYVYALPSDCLTPRRIANCENPHIRWEVTAGRLLHSDWADFVLEYTKNVDNSGDFVPEFEDLLSLAMAINMGPSLTQDKQLVRLLVDQYTFMEPSAVDIDLNTDNTYRDGGENPEFDTFINPNAKINYSKFYQNVNKG